MQPKFTLHEVVNAKGLHFIYLRKDGTFVDCANFSPDIDGDKLLAIKKMVDLANRIKDIGQQTETLIAEL